MSNDTPTTQAVETPVQPQATPAPAATAPADAQKPAAKRAVKKAAAKKGAKKAAPKKGAKGTKAATKKAATPAKPRGGLGKPRTKILQVLKKAGKPLTRGEIGTKAGINSGFTSLLGHAEPAKREPESLLAKGYIKAEKHDQNGKDTIVYSITANGLKALEKESA